MMGSMRVGTEIHAFTPSLSFPPYLSSVQLRRSLSHSGGSTGVPSRFITDTTGTTTTTIPPSMLSKKTRRFVGNIIIILEPDNDNNDNDDASSSNNILDDADEDDDDDDAVEPDPYLEKAASEFMEESPPKTSLSSTEGKITYGADKNVPTTSIDWGGALGRLRERVEDVQTGKSQNPSQALFRLMSNQSPNQAIRDFVSTANPQVVQAMSGAVSSLLGGLSNPLSGVDTIVKATGDKVASLCFQLQMTGYLFRNAEYVMALKDLMKLKGGASLQDYKDAFDRLDTDRSGYIEASEVITLLTDVYNGDVPDYEVKAFVKFFDTDRDGKISWQEFQNGLFGMAENVRLSRQKNLLSVFSLPGGEDDDDLTDPIIEPQIAGKLEIQLEDGKVVSVDAEEYVRALKEEAKSLKEALKRESGIGNTSQSPEGLLSSSFDRSGMESITSFIASRQGDVKSLTEGISPEIVETMRMLVDFVLQGPEDKAGKKLSKEEMEMVIPAPALQQLALWQLVLGYRLREAEAKGDYIKLLE